MYIRNKDFLLAKNICYKALEIGELHGASDRDRMRYTVVHCCGSNGQLIDVTLNQRTPDLLPCHLNSHSVNR